MTSEAVLPSPSSQVNVTDSAAVRLPGRQKAVVLRLLLSSLSSSPPVATVAAVVFEAVVVATAAAAAVVVAVKPTITRVAVVGATAVKAVLSSSPC